LQIAEVVIANTSRELDRIFHYNVPNDAIVSVGSRVLVPFGMGNKTAEGIIVGFVSESIFKRLKNINLVLDNAPLCTKELCDLALWMRKKYLCTYYQALKSVMPSGISVKTTEWITLINSNIDKAFIDKACGKSTIQKSIILRLKDAGGTLDFGSIADISSARIAIKALAEKGIVSLDESTAQNVKSKSIRMVDITSSYDEITDNIHLLHKKAPKQAKMLEILRQTGSISVADLVAFSGGSYSAVNSLHSKGLVAYEDKIILRTAYDEENYAKTTSLTPTDEQSVVLSNLKKAEIANDLTPILLKGVTGSGKTEVFLQIIEHIIEKKKQAIVLVPEISLTPQMVSRFVARFGKQVSVLHSGLSLGERYDEWSKIRSGKVSVAVGARSAIFAPFENLGIIIIDEEQELTYKSESPPHYNAKEVAIFRSKNEGAMVILASATPSIDSYYKAKSGEYKLFEMKSRHNFACLPHVEVIDMRNELQTGNKSVFSAKLKSEIEKNLENGEQTILFHNRRGFNSFVMCRTCGESLMCNNCSVTLTFHKHTGQLKCHYCGFERENVTSCPSCDSPHIRFVGTGTEKIEEEIIKLFGLKSFIRMDADTTAGKHSHEIILRRFERENIPILLGTQMVTKGLDFPNVTLVGVLVADLSLNIDDFRAAERTFSQLTQVCGRAGRGDLSGRAIVQTYQPEHYAVQLAKNHDYTMFYDHEINIRRQLDFPPFCDLVMLLMQGDNEKSVCLDIMQIAEKLKGLDIKILGPIPAPYPKIKNKYRWRILIKCQNSEKILEVLHNIITEHTKKDNLLTIDINPNNMN